MNNEIFPGFVLRHAAGMWNLLDCNHPELSYKKPLQLNEAGAQIWENLCNGLTLNEIAVDLSRKYGISQEEAKADVYEFAKKLRAFGVPL